MPVGGDEFELIARLRRQTSVAPDVPIGIGDDAALIRSGPGGQLLVAKDVLLEGVHFDLSTATPQEVGRKALAVNLSDLAAMAGRPTSTFVGVAFSQSAGPDFADRLMTGLLQLAQTYEVTLAGGDTNIWDGPTVISVTLVGSPTGSGPVTRAGAVPGDWLMVTGPLGGSLRGRHLTFIPRVVEARQLHQSVELHAMIDLSDGLASDVQHLAAESRVGVTIDAGEIPIHSDVDSTLSREERLQQALSDGEDFELLFAVSPDDGRRLLKESPLRTPLYKIGEATSSPGCWLQIADGKTPLVPTGWQHRFKSS